MSWLFVMEKDMENRGKIETKRICDKNCQTVEVADQNGKSGFYVDSKGNILLKDKHEFKFKTLY